MQSYRLFITLLIPFLKSSTLKWISIPPLHSNNLRKLRVGAQWISFKDSTDLTLIADLLTHGPLRALCLSHSALRELQISSQQIHNMNRFDGQFMLIDIALYVHQTAGIGTNDIFRFGG